ncbi:MAG: glycosyltransferase, partial [Planctomycetaceae bacterium]|nr:glycosyltransferase [Planctomycetaceae bacterium]
MRVGLVFDDRVRHDTTGVYLLNALRQRVQTIHIRPTREIELQPADVDFYVMVVDGLDYEIPDHFRPRAAWAIDTHLGFNRCVTRFGDADVIFAAQKHDAYRLSETLGCPVHWLPMACDPAIHCPVPGEIETHDVVFVGNTVSPQRQRWLSFLMEHFPGSWVGRAYFGEMARAYSRGRVGFNFSVAGDVNMRMFEIAACGLPLVTNRLYNNGLEELFDIGSEILVWENEDDLTHLILELLESEAYRRKIGNAGRIAACQRHTYSHRADVILARLKEVAGRVSKHGCYFEFDRPDVRSLIPQTARKILDVGCGSGKLGAAVRGSQPCHVTGIEPVPDAAARARRVLDAVVCRRICDLPIDQFAPEAFDCIVLADVLEHLRDPVSALQKCGHWLTSTGTLVISVPNSRNHEVLAALAHGDWTYESAGLLDDDHVRCFTRREMEKLLYRARFAAAETQFVADSGFDAFRKQPFSGTIQFGNLRISQLSRAEADEFYAYQLLMTARKSPHRDFGLTSIIIVTFNQLACTRMCVESVLSRTDEEIELIFIDNGSTDGTVEYLQSVRGATVLQNSTNRGFAPAVNQGLQVATGSQIRLLNNDCIVTTGWLNALLEGLYEAPDIGMIGPVSNCVSGTQQIDQGYSSLSSLDGFAWDRRKFPESLPTNRLVGFCLLFRRAVLTKVGMLDEQFRIGCFEDDDFCLRAIAAGFQLRIASHVFVHHFGNATFKGAGISLAQAMQENAARFHEKWQPANLSYANEVTPACPKMSLCMIVRDNESIIESCVLSIRPWVDEMIVVDTGSVDRTPAICRKLGAKVFEFPWCDDFSAARNESLRHATGEWIFWMDSDDVIDGVQGERLRQLVNSTHKPTCSGYVMQVHCPSADPGVTTVVDHVKLIRNRRDLRFEHRIHEQILPR